MRCDALEGYIRSEGVETLYLLTTTAAAYFDRRGYKQVAREAVNEAIQGTTEFTDLCPETATCIRKRL